MPYRAGADLPATEVLRLFPVDPIFKCLPQSDERTSWWHFYKSPETTTEPAIGGLFAAAS